jgi:hypothetical protein
VDIPLLACEPNSVGLGTSTMIVLGLLLCFFLFFFLGCSDYLAWPSKTRLLGTLIAKRRVGIERIASGSSRLF